MIKCTEEGPQANLFGESCPWWPHFRRVLGRGWTVLDKGGIKGGLGEVQHLATVLKG